MHDSIANASNGRTRLTVCLSISLLLLMLGGWLTSLGMGQWYQELELPPFQPPAWIFTPAWITLLTMLAVATWIITCKNGRESPMTMSIALLLYGLQLALNAGWSLLFFAVQRPDFALGEIIALDAVLLGMIFVYGRISKTAGLLLVPYFLWLLFATAINAWIVINNEAFA